MNDSATGIDGGGQKSFTFGLNWELNPMSRVMYNYVRADFSNQSGGYSGNLNSNLIRFQVDY